MKKTSHICLLTLALTLFSCSSPEIESEQKIVNGEAVSQSKDQRIVPSVVKIKFYDPDPTGKDAMCTGFLIGPTHIVTAAHCLLGNEGLSFVITFGSGGNQSVYYPQIVKRSQPHPLWNFENISVKYDIGLISLKVPLDTEHPGDPVFKSLEILDISSVKVGDEVHMAGYGKLNSDFYAPRGELYQTKEKVAFLDAKTRSFSIQHGLGTGACQGDSGGPGTFDIEGKLKVAGILHGEGVDINGVSLEGRPCDEGFGTYAAISLYQGWMKCTFESHGNPLPGLKDDESSAECAHNPPVKK